MNPIKCPQCNLVNFVTAVSCGRCGYQFQEVKKPMPPIRAAGAATNLNAQAGAIANAKTPPSVNPPEQVSQNPNVNYQQPLAKYNPPTIQQNSNLQQLPQPTQTQYQQPQPNRASGVMGNSAEKNAALADIVLEANSTSPVVKILMLPFTIVRKIAGFLYSHKKVAALMVAPAAIAVVVGPNLLEAVKSANENSAIATIKQVNQAQTTFLATKQRCGELKELEQSQLIDSSIGSGKKSGFVFTVNSIPGGCEIYAKPTEMEGLTATGNRSFYYSTRDNTLRVSEDKKVLASAKSQALDVGGEMKQGAEKPKIAQK